jgi:U3 small nucleolar RNA-associated protein 14
MKQVCANCHFLAKEHREPNTGRVLSFSVSDKERHKAKNSINEFVNESYSLKCHMGVWDEGISPDKEGRIDRVNNVERMGLCFFYPYNQSMMFDAAMELQKREQEYRQVKLSNMYTRVGLWVASGALLVNAIIGLIRLSKCA